MGAKSFTVPTIYTAIDKYTGPVVAMAGVTDRFASRTEKALSTSNKLFNKLTPSIGAAGKQLLSYASATAVATGVLAAGNLGIKSLLDYETEVANLRALTGKSGKDFEKYEAQIDAVSMATRKSKVETVQAFTAIANNQPALLEDANALAMVTQNSILLAKASKMELGPAGEALTQILNQYGKGAEFAAKTVDILAAGSVAGSSEIRDTAAAIQQFGTVAANSMVAIDESVALVELASRFEKGSEAGSKLRNILITMGAIKVQDPKALKDLKRLGVNLDIVSNKALPFNTRLLEMAKVSKDNTALFHIFGKENQAMAAGVLTNAEKFADYQIKVNKAGEATRMANENMNTLRNRLQEVKGAFVNAIIGTNGQSDAMERARKIAKFLGDNMSTILKWTIRLVTFFAIWKGLMIVSRIAMVAYNIAFGINNALQKRSLFFTEGNIIAKRADLIATRAITGAQWLWNAAMSANPIGLVIIAIGALIVLVIEMVKHWDEWGSSLSACLGPLGLVIAAVSDFSDNWSTVEKEFERGGMMAAINQFGNVFNSTCLRPVQLLVEFLAKLTGSTWLSDMAVKIQDTRNELIHGAENNNPVPGGLGQPILDRRTVENDNLMSRMVEIQKQNVNININDKTNGRAKVSSDNNIIPVKVTSTQSWAQDF